MSNGAQCCALEICCDPPAAREKLPAIVAKHAGVAATPAHAAVVRQATRHDGARGPHLRARVHAAGYR